MHNILIFPCGAENAIELYDSLRYSPHFEVFGASSVKDKSSIIYPPDRLLKLPHIKAKDFISALNALIRQYGIDLIFPSHDTVLLELVKNRHAIDAQVAACDLRTAELCRYKNRLYEYFAGESFIPEWSLEGPLKAKECFLKPVAAQGGQMCVKAKNTDPVPPGCMLCEYLPGPEYTIDCFTDRHGTLVYAGPRTRDIIRMGIAFSSAPYSSPALDEIARTLNEKLGFRGLWFFQTKDGDDGSPKLLEISSRIATTMGLSRQRGVNLPLMAAYDLLDKDVSVIPQDFSIRLERTLRTIYDLGIAYSTIYVDYDDTLTVRGRVNAELLKFLYECVDCGKKIVLLTRHEGDMDAELARRRIAASLFDEIIHLPPDADKTAHVTAGGIYIDNMFHDRQKVAEKIGIPVFDVDAASALLPR